MNEQISLGGHRVSGFALADDAKPKTFRATPVVAALMVGGAVGFGAHMFKASMGYSILLGAAAAVLAKIGIDKASA